MEPPLPHPKFNIGRDNLDTVPYVLGMKKCISIMMVGMLGAVLAVPTYAQTASSSAASAQGETPEVRVVAILAPPGRKGTKRHIDRIQASNLGMRLPRC
jgi:hypothetical protein